MHSQSYHEFDLVLFNTEKIVKSQFGFSNFLQKSENPEKKSSRPRYRLIFTRTSGQECDRSLVVITLAICVRDWGSIPLGGEFNMGE